MIVVTGLHAAMLMIFRAVEVSAKRGMGKVEEAYAPSAALNAVPVAGA